MSSNRNAQIACIETPRSSRRGPARAQDALREPALDFFLDPTDRTSSDAYASWKPPVGFELVDHRTTKPCRLAYLGQSQYLNLPSISLAFHDDLHVCGSGHSGANCHPRSVIELARREQGGIEQRRADTYVVFRQPPGKWIDVRQWRHAAGNRSYRCASFSGCKDRCATMGEVSACFCELGRIATG